MGEGRTFKYVKYAIGEIALVVIGILLALQINNWNLERIDRLHEAKILHQLQADLRQNEIEVTGLLELNRDRLRCCDSIHVYWQERRAVNDSLRYYFEKINSDGLFNNAKTTYEYIKNQGTSFLTNDSLRDQIVNMFEKEFENISTRERLSWKVVIDELRPAYNRELSTSNSIGTPGSLSVNDPVFPERIWDDHAFINAITNLQWILKIRVTWLPETLERLTVLQTDVDTEIQRLTPG